MDRDGQLLARLRISGDAAGLAALLGLLAGHGDSAGDLIPVAIETPRGLLTACLRATGRQVYPMAVARYRDRHSIAGRKSDHGDAVVLANVLRTGLHAHRPLPADSELAQAIAVLARAQQDAVWDRTAAHNKLRSHLREYFPAFLAAFAGARGGIMRAGARAILAAAPAPAAAAALTLTQLKALLRKVGRSRGIDAGATPGSARRSAHRRCASTRWRKKRWDARPWPCCATSTQPAPVTAHQARPPPSCTGASRTSASPPPATSGPPPPSAPHPAPASTTTGAKPTVTVTPPPSGTSSAGSSAACTTA